ncbi:hypothetical protein GA0061071_102231 [Kosakonia oryzendophytica]|uniref:Uncharacterized protein n=1 Tax=Kosakonia oryzendophytica TaxID=1005665 RepID=A0A1C3ZX75_9ENTR|nr:Hypothetical protein AKI40_4478 [Enterobacter sp. FY-07]SCB86953.1 hypothetical protein GA0061071_102231 [Kosakonia oryzendophytica]
MNCCEAVAIWRAKRGVLTHLNYPLKLQKFTALKRSEDFTVIAYKILFSMLLQLWTKWSQKDAKNRVENVRKLKQAKTFATSWL